MFSTKGSLVCATLVLLCAEVLGQGSRYHSAKCLELGEQCTEFYENLSKACKAGLSADLQSKECHILACRWCTIPENDKSALCNTEPLRVTCGLDGEDTMPNPAPAPMSQTSVEPVSASVSCTYGGESSVAIALDSVAAPEAWSPASRGGLNGIVFRPDRNHGTVRPGQGEICFPVRMAESGDYFLTAVSYAPHATENNDMWVKADKPMRLWRRGQNRFFDIDANMYLKAYQNNGSEGLSTIMVTKDSDGHFFSIRGVIANETFHMCMDGRSYRYEVYKVVLKKCSGDVCTGRGLDSNEVMSMPATRCS